MWGKDGGLTHKPPVPRPAPGTEHLISEMLQTLTKRLSHSSSGPESVFSGDASSGSPPPTARALKKCQICQRCMMDQTLLQLLVEVMEEWEENARAWQVEDISGEEAQDWHREEWDWTSWEFRAELLALECEQIQVLQEQNTILG
ncbi:hypothetical protein Y1Q_0015713 [Alligator mississippiensis]|uniref:Uncharacterized protein n=1 Tax=Alligator mississippiensis TaxID=8496 RepID=A0A151NNX5_ALLMI|nr:hypothetical protein Y1Q_0015713 [Alligator mississippiensis]